MDEQAEIERDATRVFQITAEKEAAAYDVFSRRFDLQFPMPPAPSVKMMSEIGWQFISIIIQSVFAIVLAALRTADMFFAASAGTSVPVQWIEAVAAVGAIELGIVIFSTIKSEIENSKTELEDLKSAMKIDVRLLWTGIIACVAISIIAGLGVSFKGFGLDFVWMDWTVAIVMGIGASLVAWVSGDILGAMLARWKNASALATLQYQQELEDREAKKRSMWEAAPERQIARSELTELKDFLLSSRQPRAPRQPKETPAPQPKLKNSGQSEVRQMVFDYLDRTWSAEQRIAGPSELHKELGVAKGYTGGEKGVIKQWIALRPEVSFPASETEEENAVPPTE